MILGIVALILIGCANNINWGGRIGERAPADAGFLPAVFIERVVSAFLRNLKP